MEESQKRRSYTKEFKSDAVALARRGERPIRLIAEDLGIHETVLRAWLRQADVDAGKGPSGSLTTSERDELTKLRRQVRVLEEEREILKKAAAFFAKEGK